MKRQQVRALAAGAGFVALAGISPALAAPPSTAIVLTVDATNAATGHLRTHEVIPARPGPLTLAYPKWIPGEHGPTGPLNDVVALTISANGKPLVWHRNPDEMFEITVTVPEGASSVEVDFDGARTGNGVYSGNAVASEHMVDVVWNQTLLYPKGSHAATLFVEPTVKLPKGWAWASALAGPKEHDGVLSFAKVSLEMLVDSPLVAGAHVKTFDLGNVGGAAHSLVAVGENEASLAARPELVEGWKHLVVQANALFGAHHYDHYQFLAVLSDHISWFGLEHHQSSEDYMKERTLIDAESARAFGDLLAHEYVHSWNGKYRRPLGLATPSFQEPMRGDLLWVYEGLTNYLGWVLAARSGIVSFEDAKQQLVGDLLDVDTSGRNWRPLADTATAAQVLYDAGRAGRSARRSVDYYSEGTLLWLEVDVLIRKKTNGARSIDDFCQRFHGGKSSSPEVRPYELAEVLKTLNEVAPNDWKTFFDERVFAIAPKPPLGGVEGAGYHVARTDKKPELYGAMEKTFKTSSYWESLGFSLNGENEIRDVLDGGPASRAGLTPKMTVIAVNGRKMSPESMTDALAATGKKTRADVEIITERDGYYRTFEIPYQEGATYKVLERNADTDANQAKPDLLAAILAPVTPK